MVKIVKMATMGEDISELISSSLLTKLGLILKVKLHSKLSLDIYIYTSSTHIGQLLLIFDETLTATEI